MTILSCALDFLKMHGGSCSVHKKSPYGIAFLLMEQSGRVRIQPSSTVDFIDVYDLDFKPKFNGENNK